ncbi:MAG: chorismate synthase [Phycisphaerales bacterium]|nr:chorismate synthase [Phycisphaerales bacterium]
MSTLTCNTAGESHGPGLIVLINGLPAGLEVDTDLIDAELHRRQGGFGRGGRQRIEQDRVELLAGVRLGRTIGSPVAMRIANRDSRLDDVDKTPPVHCPRPGHADLPGSIKHLTTDCRETLERASARETAARVAAGALTRGLLREFSITTFSFVRSILDAMWTGEPAEANLPALLAARDASEVYCPDPSISEEMIARIRRAAAAKDTLGGLVETHVFGCPIGLGSCANWYERLDSRIAAAVMGIQAFKAVEIGMGKECASRPGSQVHDPIGYDPTKRDTPALGFTRQSNNAGGIEGGMTNGQPVVVRGAMKPISTLLQGMPSVDLRTKQAARSDHERSDTCAVSAASVVMENVVAFEIARALIDKFAGDSMTEMRRNYDAYLSAARDLGGDAG